MHTTPFEKISAALLGARTKDVAEAESGVSADDAVTLDVVEGVSVLLVRMPEAAAEQAMLCADCGELPAEGEAAVLQQTMVMNLLLYRDIGATFCVNPASGHLLLLGRVDLATATPDSVREMARKFAQGVLKYQRDHFEADLTADATEAVPTHPGAAFPMHV